MRGRTRKGKGQLPIRAFLEQLRQQGYAGSVLLESWWPPGTDDAMTVSGERASVESGISTLKDWLENG